MTTQYIVEEILRRNIADLEKELQRQKERHAAATARLRDQIERVTSEWKRVESAMASAREDLQLFVDSRDTWMARAMAAEAELKAAREQEPVLWRVNGNYFRDSDSAILFKSMNTMFDFKIEPLYARPIPAPAAPDGWREQLLAEFPLFDDDGLCQEKHHCEWALQQDRKRLHAMLQSAPTGEPK